MSSGSSKSHCDHNDCKATSRTLRQKVITTRSVYLAVSQRTDEGIYWNPSGLSSPHLNYGIFIGPSDWHLQPQKVELALHCAFYEVVWKYHAYSLEDVWHFNDFRICATWKKSLLGLIKLAEVPKRHNKRKNSMPAIKSALEAIQRPHYNTPEEDSWCWVQKATSSLQNAFKAMPREVDWDALFTQSRNLASRAISKELVRQQGAIPLGIFDAAVRREYEIRYKVKKSLRPAKLLVEVLEPTRPSCPERANSVLHEDDVDDESTWDEKKPILKKGRSWTFKKSEFS